jgi:hypothetical protein
MPYPDGENLWSRFGTRCELYDKGANRGRLVLTGGAGVREICEWNAAWFYMSGRNKVPRRVNLAAISKAPSYH